MRCALLTVCPAVRHRASAPGEKNDFEGLESLFQAFFSSIPYEWYTVWPSRNRRGAG